MRKKRNQRKIYFFLIVLIGIFGIIKQSYSFRSDNINIDNQSKLNNNTSEKNEIVNEQELKIHFLDVGQGDSIFIELPNSQTMLIDGAEAKEKDNIINYIKKCGYSNIDYLLATHPHADHIGSLKYVVETFNIGSVYMPKALSTSKTYENFLKSIEKKNLKIKNAKAGIIILETEQLKIEFLSPMKESYQNINNYSAVIKMTYNEKIFLFMGDAEKEIEDELQSDVKSNVIKVGHHGSDTSSSINFVKKVKPDYAVISVGLNNSYHHPSDTIIDRWHSVGAIVLRTDLNGTIIARTDGYNLEVTSTKKE